MLYYVILYAKSYAILCVILYVILYIIINIILYVILYVTLFVVQIKLNKTTRNKRTFYCNIFDKNRMFCLMDETCSSQRANLVLLDHR